jgi:hypothetical protein
MLEGKPKALLSPPKFPHELAYIKCLSVKELLNLLAFNVLAQA